jgi:hypothetical protein
MRGVEGWLTVFCRVGIVALFSLRFGVDAVPTGFLFSLCVTADPTEETFAVEDLWLDGSADSVPPVDVPVT